MKKIASGTALAVMIFFFSLFFVTSCAQFINANAGWTIPYTERYLRHLEEIKYTKVTDNVISYASSFTDKIDWNSFNFINNYLEIEVKGKPTQTVSRAFFNNLFDNGYVMLNNAEADKEFDVKFPRAYSSQNQITNNEPRLKEGYSIDYCFDSPVDNFFVDDFSLTVNVKEGFALIKDTTSTGRYQRSLYFDKVYNLFPDCYINVSLSFVSPIEMDSMEITFNPNGMPGNFSGTLNDIKKGQNEINLVLPANGIESSFGADGMNFLLHHSSGEATASAIILEDFKIDFSVSDRPSEPAWKFDNGTLSIIYKAAFNEPSVSADYWKESDIKKSDITSVVIGSNVKEISDSAFDGCNNISSITISDSVVKIGQNAFYNNQCTEVYIPGSVKEIGYNAFYTTGETIDFSLGWGVCGIRYERKFHPNIFGKAKSVVTSDGYYLVNKASWTAENVFYKIDGDLMSFAGDGKKIYDFTGGGDFSAKFPDITTIAFNSSIKGIGIGAFHGCYNVRNIQFAGEYSEIESIEQSAFSNHKCTKISIPASVKTIGKRAFAPDGGYMINTEITLEWNRDDTTVRNIDQDAFYGTKSVKYKDGTGYQH